MKRRHRLLPCFPKPTVRRAAATTCTRTHRAPPTHHPDDRPLARSPWRTCRPHSDAPARPAAAPRRRPTDTRTRASGHRRGRVGALRAQYRITTY
eukprot:1901185-Prymnesium_polylepis.1